MRSSLQSKNGDISTRLNKIISVFRVTGLKILGRVGALFFFWKKYNFMHFERHFAFQNACNYIFSRKPEKILSFTRKFR